MMQGNVFLGLGSNLGEREAYLDDAIARLNRDQNINVLNRSSMMETEPLGELSQPLFLNMVVEIETKNDPEKLLDVCLAIELANGRVRGQRWGPRTLDIDILFYGSEIINKPSLQIPHPELARRYFVLAPMAEIAPKFEHPVLKEPVLAMLQLL